MNLTKLGFKKRAQLEELAQIAGRLDDVAIAAARSINPKSVNRTSKKINKALGAEVLPEEKEKKADMSQGMTENVGPEIMITELTPEVMEDLSEIGPEAPRGKPGEIHDKAVLANNQTLAKLNRVKPTEAPIKNVNDKVMYEDQHLTRTQP